MLRRPQLLALGAAGIDQRGGLGLRRGMQLLGLGASSVEHRGGVALGSGAQLGGLLLRGSAPLCGVALGLRRLLPRLREPAASVLLDGLEHLLALVEMVLDLPGGLVHPALGKPSAHLLQVLLDLVWVVPAPHLAEVPLDDEHGQRLGSSAHTRRVSASLAGVLLRRRDEADPASGLRQTPAAWNSEPAPVVIPVTRGCRVRPVLQRARPRRPPRLRGLDRPRRR